MKNEINKNKALSQTSVSGCFCKDVDLEKPKCEKQCELCKRLELEYSFKN